MPLHFTEYVFQRLKHAGDGTMAAFLDIFHHRMISFFYRAWALHQQTVSFDRGDDPMGSYIASIFGLGMDSLRNRDAVPDIAKLHYSGHLACVTRHASGLQSLLEGDLGIPTEIQQFVGQWLPLPEQSRCALGLSPDSGCLGSNLVVGSRIWDCVQRFRIRLGPMHQADYMRFLPGAEGLQRLNAWVRNYASLELEWDVQLVLLAEDVKPICMGQGDNARLGQTTWLLSASHETDADDLVLGSFGADMASVA